MNFTFLVVVLLTALAFVGYTDSSHFIVMFKKLTGMTPAQFRRQ
jgi:AraC-like DNA-binding protein